VDLTVNVLDIASETGCFNVNGSTGSNTWDSTTRQKQQGIKLEALLLSSTRQQLILLVGALYLTVGDVKGSRINDSTARRFNDTKAWKVDFAAVGFGFNDLTMVFNEAWKIKKFNQLDTVGATLAAVTVGINDLIPQQCSRRTWLANNWLGQQVAWGPRPVLYHRNP